MNILVITMFWVPLVLMTLYLYLAGVFTNRKAFQFTFSLLLAFFALTIGIVVQYSYQSYYLPAASPVALIEGMP